MFAWYTSKFCFVVNLSWNCFFQMDWLLSSQRQLIHGLLVWEILLCFSFDLLMHDLNTYFFTFINSASVPYLWSCIQEHRPGFTFTPELQASCDVEGDGKATCDLSADWQGPPAFGNLLNLGLLRGIKMLFDYYDLCISSLHLRTSSRKAVVTPKYNLELFCFHDIVWGWETNATSVEYSYWSLVGFKLESSLFHSPSEYWGSFR